MTLTELVDSRETTSGAECRRPAIHGEGELVEFDDADFEYRREFWRLLEAQRQAAGYKPGWAAYRFRDVFGRWPMGFVQAVRKVVAEGQLDAAGIDWTTRLPRMPLTGFDRHV